MIVNGGYGAHSGHAAIARGEADLVAFGVTDCYVWQMAA
jgi:N-ethylmaleimide reductase